MTLSNYVRLFPSDNAADSVILYSTKKSSTVIVPRSMIGDIEHGLITPEECATLVDLGFLLEDPATETQVMRGYIAELNKTDHILAAKVVLNLDCNLACKYCFEGQRKGKYYMSKEMADSFVDFMRNRMEGKEEIRVTYYGGEPLLSLELISYISGKLSSLAENNGLSYTAFIITNGTLLTSRTAARLKSLGIREAAVTVDGPRDIHDRLRPFRGGRGSFDAILSNIKEAWDEVDIEVGGNFTKENYRDMPRLLDYMIEEGLTPDKIRGVRFDPVTTESDGIAPPDFHDGCATFNEPWLFEAAVWLREEALMRGFKANRTMPMTCLIDIDDRFVVNFDGAIYKCPGLIGRKEFCAGNIAGGVKDYRQSHYLDNWKNDECLECSYLPLCFGGCRYMRLVREGDMSGVDCKKPYYDATLEAFVKQDIRYGLAE